MSLRNVFCERLVLPLSDLLQGERTSYYLRMLKKAETWSDPQLQEFQNQRLQRLIHECVIRVPFYKDWFNEHHLAPEDIHTTADLVKLPVLNKAIMRQEGIGRFTNSAISPSKRLASRSSGSTGEPFSFYVSKEANSINTAAKLLTWYHAGYRLGDRYMKIANGERHGKLKKWQDRINNCIYVPFGSMGDDTLVSILEKIEETRPTIIRSYPIPLYLLAQYRNKHSGYTHSPRYIMTTGSTLSQTYRQEIELAFGCEIIDSYSCEGVANTAETPAHDGYHITRAYGIIEVLDDDNRPVTNGIGRVVGTDLWNFAHPFVRYDSQDLVEMKDGRIQRIMGRQSECVLNAQGERFTVHNFSHFFLYDLDAVNAYQVVMRQDGSALFRLVVNDKFNMVVENQVISYWQQRLHAPVIVELVDAIPLMKNNKYLAVIDESKQGVQ